ncbi:FecR domain-containing protein [Thalassospira sp.]|uniref:FecR family protein n=1 Tax=Thalassospira sp. TaxID=1912094 RepID=UPI0032ECA154
MTGITDPVQKQVAQEATDWLILLQDDPDNAELSAQFAQWCGQSDDHIAAWNATCKAADLMAQVKPFDADVNQGGQADWQRFLAKTRAENNAEKSEADETSEPNKDAAGINRGDGPNDHPDGPVMSEDAKSLHLPNGTVISLQSRFDQRGNKTWRGIGLGGLAVAASLMAAIIGPKIATELRADHISGTAEIKTITLSDNSTVTLAPESAITVRFDGKTRFVELLDGEAFFDVTPNPEQPFQVGADTVTVTVLGTGFDVSDSGNVSKVGVEHGLVQVDNADHVPELSQKLTAGEAIRVARDGSVIRSTTPKGQVAPWRNHQLIAQDQPLAVIVDQLRRYYSGTILITDEALGQQTVTGVYRLDDPVSALRGMARAQNATVRELTPWVLIVSPS